MRERTSMLLVYRLTIFISSALLFFIQPMFARIALPILGGAPSVWNTALVFYQAALLAGYAYAHISVGRLGVRRQAVVHLGMVLLAALTLPIGLPHGWSPPSNSDPTAWLLAAMLVSLGMPFVVISATSPLLQTWFHATRHGHASDPYFLYTTSNLGSMLALLSYPAVIEPFFPLATQMQLWSLAYVLLFGLTGACAWFVWRSRAPAGEAGTESDWERTSASLRMHEHRDTTWVTRFRWIVLAFVPASLMLSVTTFMTADIAGMPFFWVLPLAIYLGSFMLVFAQRPVVNRRWMAKAVPILALPLMIALIIRPAAPVPVMSLHLAALFVICVVCHGELARTRPAPRHLTAFYFLMSAGGVLGGSFNALLAPKIFTGLFEYGAVLALACMLLPWKTEWPFDKVRRLLDVGLPALTGGITVAIGTILQSHVGERSPLWIALTFGIPAVIAFSFSRRPLRFGLSVAGIMLASTLYLEPDRSLLSERSFFGIHKVVQDSKQSCNQLFHGTTLHGSQSLDPQKRRIPGAYYYPTGPVGQFFTGPGAKRPLRKVAVVGLGAGALLSYARPGERWTVYEIDPTVVRIARDPRFFTYFQDCPAGVEVVLGDGRLSLSQATEEAYDVLILDAYSSDSLPVHLLTREALALYLSKLTAGGVIVFHVSHRYLDLEPVLGNLAANLGLDAVIQYDTVLTEQEVKDGKAPSIYVIAARGLQDFHLDSRWRKLRTNVNAPVWTDDYSSVLSILRLRLASPGPFVPHQDEARPEM